MKIRWTYTLLPLLYCCIIWTASGKSFNYPDQWKHIADFESKGLPKSALQGVDSLMKVAKQENNSPQYIKGWIYRFRFLTETDQDLFIPELNAMEQYTATCNNATEQAMLHSIIAKLYEQYYSRNQYTINQRTRLSGYRPENMKEWNASVFADTVAYHVRASLTSASELQALPATIYETVMEPGKDSRTLQPSLYDFLCARGVETLTTFANNKSIDNIPLQDTLLFAPAKAFSSQGHTEYSYKEKIVDIYRQWITFRLQKNDPIALTYTNLQRLNFVYSYFLSSQKEDLYCNALQQLRTDLSPGEAVVEVIAELANYYLQHDAYDSTLPAETARFVDYKKRAFDLCEEGIRLYPRYKRISNLQSIRQGITSRRINLSGSSVTDASTPTSITISATNIPAVEIRLYAIETTATDYYKATRNNSGNKLSGNAKLILTKQITLLPNDYFRATDTTIVLPQQGYGIYEYSVGQKGISDPKKLSYGHFYVSDMAFFSRTKEKNQSEIYVVDRNTGHPVDNVTVTTYNQSGYGEKFVLSKQLMMQTDKNGHTEFNSRDNRFPVIQLSKGKDLFSPCHSISSYYPENIQYEKINRQLNLFTDRAIYRPGQTVYFKGIAWTASEDSSHVCYNQKYVVTLRDANYQEVSKQTLTTNNFGSFAGSFTLPKGGLNGNFSIESEGNAAISFRVEEYKRPTFEINFDTIQGTPAFGDQVKITGNIVSYTGFPIENATVQYRIIRRPHWLIRWWSGGYETEIQNGKLASDAKGKFGFTFTPQKEASAPFTAQLFYSYTITTSVTDANGETQTKETTCNIGDRSMYLTSDLAESVNKANPTDIRIEASNLNGAPVTTTVTYTLSRLKPATEYAEKIHKTEEPCIDQEVNKGTIDTSQTLNIPINNFSNWQSGKYLLSLSCKDNQNREVTYTKTFEVYSSEDQQLSVKRFLWINEEKTTCKPGETAIIQCGTSAPDAKILYELLNGNTIVERTWMSFNNEIKSFRIPYKPEWESNASVRVTLVKEGLYFSKIIHISRTTEEKTLKPTFSVFRNKLLPGAKEEWTVSIPELKNSGKQAECMITMYDASLNTFTPHAWNFTPAYRSQTAYITNWNFTSNTPVYGDAEYTQESIYNTAGYSFDRFNNIINQLFYDYSPRVRIRGMASLAKIETGGPPPSQDALNEVVVTGYAAAKKNAIAGSIAQKEKPVQLRSNFAETAFFYPQLRTNESGDLSFSFTVPESLTRWNVMGLAHTRDLYSGQWLAETVTQKPFMVQPNLPRFVRESDRLVISAKLINLLEKPQQGTARLELIDPETDKPLAVNEANVSFELGKGVTQTVNWSLSGFTGKQLLICKITASTGEFSDGEQRYIPVLPDKIRITETLPMQVRGNQTKHYTFDRLLSENSHVESKNLTAEISANPSWYAVQALPALSNPDNDCSVSWFSSYYANTLAAAIANSNPALAKTYTQWQATGNALQSNLEKNEELKNILLTETPWVTEAKNESEQKQRLAELFDQNRQADKRREALDKLASLQSGRGGFFWFKGMPEDRFLTQYIAEGMARLHQMKADSLSTKEAEITGKAIAFADEQMARDFVDLKRTDSKWQKLQSLTPSQIYYFYMRSSYQEIPVAENATEAVAFYQKRLSSSWTESSLFGKALIAITAQRQGNKKLAADIVKSLLEFATVSDEKGMYWANNRSGVWWHESNIATHTAILEAINEINANTRQTDDMKLWLLLQKQTERWHSPIATVDAVYALLNSGSNWLSGSNNVSLKLGDALIKPDTKESGTGYLKNTFDGEKIKPSMANIVVANQENHPAWGAVYWQYETTADKVSASRNTSLSVDKKLYIERSSPTGPTLIPATDNSVLQAGDKLTVRLTINTDRDMEYVALTDQRAACLEPVEQLSGCRWKERLCYYQNTKDASMQFFISYLPKGTYVFEYSAWITRKGTYNNGIATIQCMYAPEFSSHSAGTKLTVQ